ARIVGTEYLVRADGAVTVLSGEVSLNFNLPGNGGSVKVEVAAGFSFNPATGKVVPTTAGFLLNIIAHVNTVRNNAMVFKAGGATLVVKPENHVSPVHPGDDNGQGDDNNGQGDNGQGGGGNGNGQGNGKGKG